tara:strand:+ start:992 stop:1498 length:507 start_codon:yes stop_codon:yes gene_type:complete
MTFNNFLVYFTSCIIITVGCNIYSFSGSSIPKNAQTVYIKDVENGTLLSSPELTQLITESLNNYILTETKLKTSENNPDLTFSGKITKYNISPISINSQDNASQNRLIIEIEIKYENQIDSLSNFTRKFSNYVDFNSSENFLDRENELNKLIVDKLVEDVFYASFSNW